MARTTMGASWSSNGYQVLVLVVFVLPFSPVKGFSVTNLSGIGVSFRRWRTTGHRHLDHQPPGRRQRRLPPLTNHYPSSFVRGAIIFGPDGEAIPDEENDAPSSSSPALVEALATALQPSVLVRVACAFAPSPYAESLHPMSIASATLVEASHRRIGIAVSVPSTGAGGTGDTMVQLLVRVDLPSNGDEEDNENGKDTTESTLQKVMELDHEAQASIFRMEQRQDEHEAEAAEVRLVADLEAEPSGDQLPDWWTFPELKITLADECTSLKKLLNEDDFSADRLALCQHYRQTTKGFLRARVACVGPSGIFLRAVSEGTIEPVDFALPFPQGPAETSDDLRSRVLDLIESIEPTMPATNPTPTEPVLLSQTEPAPENVAKLEVQAQEEEAADAIKSKEAARRQPKPPEEEARLAAKYAAIQDLGDRAFAILQDLYMV